MTTAAETLNQALETVAKVSELPEPVLRRGLNEAQWRTLTRNLFPGADPQSVLMVVDYCQARKLDPLKKPCHIVPMKVKDSRTNEYSWRDVVMPGICEYRITAQRTGVYCGHGEATYGPVSKQAGVDAPEWCAMTFLRWNPEIGREVSYPVRVFFSEVVALKSDGKTANDRWSRAPIQMLTKCCEAAGLREAFPEEFGGEQTAEELGGQPVIDVTHEATPSPQPAQRLSQQPSATVAGQAVAATRPAATTTSEPPTAATVTPSAPEPPPASPSPVGVIVAISEHGNGTLVQLDNGYKAAIKKGDEKNLTAVRTAEKGPRVELIVKPPSDPAKYVALITGVTILEDARA